MNTGLIVTAAAVPVLAMASTAGAKWFGRWFGAALKASMEEAVTDIVKPHLDQLSTSMQTMRDENTRDHAEVSARLNVLETRLSAVEAHLSLNREA